MNGWVKLHRKIAENSFLMHDDKAWVVFTKLLIHVNSKGEWSGGRLQLSEIVKINQRTLYDVLKRLKSQQIINIKSNNRYSVITICNWSKYQSISNNKTNSDPTTNQQPTNTLIRIENKNKESESAKEKPLASNKSFRAEYERIKKPPN